MDAEIPSEPGEQRKAEEADEQHLTTQQQELWNVLLQRKHTDIRELQFSHVRVFSDSLNLQKRATKSDTSGHCLPSSEDMLCSFWELQIT